MDFHVKGPSLVGKCLTMMVEMSNPQCLALPVMTSYSRSAGSSSVLAYVS